MSEATLDPRYGAPRVAPRKRIELKWSDPRLRNIVYQVVIVGLVLLVLWYFVSNAQRHLAEQHVTTGFAFLDRNAGIPIAEHAIDYDGAVNTYGRALIVGVLNTLKVSALGLVLATILGTTIGIGRLSANWLIAKLCAVYVEVIRDIPVLLQLFFWYLLLQNLPGIQDFRRWIAAGAVPMQWNPLPGVLISQRGLRTPVLEWQAAHSWALLGLVLGIAGAVAFGRWARRRQDATGVKPAVWPMALLLVVGLPMAIWAALGAPFTLEMPVLRGFNFVGGFWLSPEFFALTFGLVVYTAAYIAEIVRSGIQAVPSGQWEAAGALGLRRSVVLKRIVLPQALRVIVPPMTSQYLNLTKNSSLAVAIGYQDVVSISQTTLNQTGQAPEGIALTMAVYLSISLSISFFMNWYNKRIALVER